VEKAPAPLHWPGAVEIGAKAVLRRQRRAESTRRVDVHLGRGVRSIGGVHLRRSVTLAPLQTPEIRRESAGAARQAGCRDESRRENRAAAHGGEGYQGLWVTSTGGPSSTRSHAIVPSETMSNAAPDRRRSYVMHGLLAAGGMATVHIGRLVGPAGFARRV